MSGDARSHVLDAAAGLLFTRACLYVMGFRRLKSTIEWLTSGPLAGGRAGESEIALARAIAKYEAAAARHLPLRTNCLDHSLTLWWLLRRRGIAAVLRIGGRKENGQFVAHAWVELSGAELDDSNNGDRKYEPFEDELMEGHPRAVPAANGR
jgi:hypothetical protein